MPIATIDPNKYERFPLKTAKANPDVVGDEDGYIMLRPLPFGMKLERRDKATRMSMEAAAGNRGRGEDNTQRFELETLSKWSRAYDFKHCIGEHNLTDVNGNALDFGNPLTLQLLDPRIGSEIESLVDKLNEDESEESLEDFTKRLTSSSPDEVTT